MIFTRALHLPFSSIIQILLCWSNHFMKTSQNVHPGVFCVLFIVVSIKLPQVFVKSAFFFSWREVSIHNTWTLSETWCCGFRFEEWQWSVWGIIHGRKLLLTASAEAIKMKGQCHDTLQRCSVWNMDPRQRYYSWFNSLLKAFQLFSIPYWIVKLLNTEIFPKWEPVSKIIKFIWIGH